MSQSRNNFAQRVRENKKFLEASSVLCSTVEVPEFRLYNNQATIAFNITFDLSKVSIRISKIMDGVSGRPVKGQDRYNYSKEACFSISSNECFKILGAYKQVLDGTYKNPESTNEKYQNTFSLTNFRKIDGNSQPSHMSIFKVESSGNPSLALAIYPPKGDQSMENASFSFSSIEELKRFISFIKRCAENLDYERSVHLAKLKSFKKYIYDGLKSSNDGQGQGYQQQNSENQQYQPIANQQPQTPPTTSNPPVNYDMEMGVDEIDI